MKISKNRLLSVWIGSLMMTLVTSSSISTYAYSSLKPDTENLTRSTHARVVAQTFGNDEQSQAYQFEIEAKQQFQTWNLRGAIDT
ncbi:MAG: hypothetical protein F6K11_30590 [Leptolyngbya sp. SIO3F4]|nr:hypothetical protein [Leptolyngbya sp. SIO3F4]